MGKAQKDIDQFINSPRYAHIQSTKKLAIKHGRCKEMVDGRCMYPHCGCLMGTDGPIDPVTGVERRRGHNE